MTLMQVSRPPPMVHLTAWRTDCLEASTRAALSTLRQVTLAYGQDSEDDPYSWGVSINFCGKRESSPTTAPARTLRTAMCRAIQPRLGNLSEPARLAASYAMAAVQSDDVLRSTIRRHTDFLVSEADDEKTRYPDVTALCLPAALVIAPQDLVLSDATDLDPRTAADTAESHLGIYLAPGLSAQEEISQLAEAQVATMRMFERILQVPVAGGSADLDAPGVVQVNLTPVGGAPWSV